MAFYCGPCDLRQLLRPENDRYICRATLMGIHKKCGIRSPLCRNCAAAGNCPKCGIWVDTIAAAAKSSDNELDTDSDDNDDEENDVIVRYHPDIRIHPPRFTPLGRTGGINAHRYWELQNDRWLHPINAPLICSGCDSPARIRCLTRVIIIARNQTTHYLHRLCCRCMRAISHREQEIVACGPNATILMELLPLKYCEAPPVTSLRLEFTYPEAEPPIAFEWTG